MIALETSRFSTQDSSWHTVSPQHASVSRVTRHLRTNPGCCEWTTPRSRHGLGTVVSGSRSPPSEVGERRKRGSGHGSRWEGPTKLMTGVIALKSRSHMRCDHSGMLVSWCSKGVKRPRICSNCFYLIPSYQSVQFMNISQLAPGALCTPLGGRTRWVSSRVSQQGWDWATTGPCVSLYISPHDKERSFNHPPSHRH